MDHLIYGLVIANSSALIHWENGGRGWLLIVIMDHSPIPFLSTSVLGQMTMRGISVAMSDYQMVTSKNKGFFLSFSVSNHLEFGDHMLTGHVCGVACSWKWWNRSILPRLLTHGRVEYDMLYERAFPFLFCTGCSRDSWYTRGVATGVL